MWSLEKRAYELYKIDWKRTNITPETELKTMQEYFKFAKENPDDDYGYGNYLFNHGYLGGQLYVCFNEFLDYEFKDKEYMKYILSDEDFTEWLNYEGVIKKRTELLTEFLLAKFGNNENYYLSTLWTGVPDGTSYKELTEELKNGEYDLVLDSMISMYKRVRSHYQKDGWFFQNDRYETDDLTEAINKIKEIYKF